MEGKHTPGPWRLTESILEDGRPFFSIAGADRVDLGYLSLRSAEELTANARLIAAAPDLLEALEAVIDDLSGGIQDCIDNGGSEAWISEADTRLKNARAAIAKARGAS